MRHLARVCLVAMLLAWSSGALVPWTTLAKPTQSVELDRTSLPQTAKARGATFTDIADTTWIAEWTFDGAGGCDAMGWEVSDHRVLNDGSNYWSLDAVFDGTGNIVGQAAVLSKHDLCWVIPDGYGNDWDYSIVCRYVGTGATLSFDYLLDSESGFDFLLVEADSACSSNSRVDYAMDPTGTPEALRAHLFAESGLNSAGSVAALALPDFAASSDTHCVYIRFFSDFAYSPEDGQQPTTLGVALVVDNLQVTGDLGYTEDFEGVSVDPNITLVNSASSQSFGLWARLHEAVTDNDPCTSNPTCSWLFSDPALPAYTPEMAFGPDGAVVRNWLDNAISSPWVSLTSTSNVVGTVVDFRRFFGQNFDSSRIVNGIYYRERFRIDNTDTPSPGDSIDCAGPWILGTWHGFSSFTWRRTMRDLTVDPAATDIQVRFRISDWQMIAGYAPPSPLDTGPGPFLDDIRIGRRITSGPVFDTWFQRGEAQDNFPTEPQPNGHFEPSDDRFGSSDFANPYRHLGGFLLPGPGPENYFVTKDSVVVDVADERGVGGVTSVDFYGAIVSGPHTGKAPPPLTVGASGFFHAAADTARDLSGLFQDTFFVDLDDDYFRGGDVLVYFWMATDGAGGVASHPAGITTLPGSIGEAETLTGGLLETNFLPTIDWDPAYLARVAADPSGKLDPTPAEISNSSQQTCILYVSTIRRSRRSGDINRTSFMYTLDQLGYRGKYDVYDHLLAGSTSNNPVGTRATVSAAGGYALIIADAPDGGTEWAIPHGAGSEQFFPQSQWYQQWLAQGATSEAGRAALWVTGEAMAERWSGVAGHVITTEMGVSLIAPQLNIGSRPEVQGLGSFTWADGSSTDFSADHFVLDARGPCEFIQESYDALGATGTASVTHRYEYAGITGDGAVVMNADPGAGWNTVFTSINWDDILRPGGGPPGTPEADLARRILDGVLPMACQALPDPTTDHFDDRAGTAPRKTALYGNAPNPFNPMTTVRFGLARPGHVDMRIYAVSGQLVRRLVNRRMEAAQHRVVWDGRDDAGIDVASGIYVLRLVADGFDGTQKLVVVR